MAKLDLFLKTAFKSNASDLHIATGEVPRVRVDGDLVPLEGPVLEGREVQELLFEILNDAERQKFSNQKNLDKSYSVKGVANFRINIFMTRKGIAAVIRTIPSKIPTFDELGLPPALKKLLGLGKGLILVTGPTGSGKSTTLSAMIDSVNRSCNYHILTIEDPVEFIHESKQSLINQREIGTSVLTFADALKYALREDPDVILVGEMRDLETIGLALTAAETGHLVFGTLHTRGAAASVDRIIDSFPGNQQSMIRTMLAESLAAVISQTLLKRVDGKGRVAAFEILIANHAISNLIREGKTFQIGNIIQTARKEGMILMDHHLLELVQQGIVHADEAVTCMEDPALLGVKPQKSQSTVSVLLPPTRPAVPTAPVTKHSPAPTQPSSLLKAPPAASPQAAERSRDEKTFNDVLTDLSEGAEEATQLYDLKGTRGTPAQDTLDPIDELLKQPAPLRDELEEGKPQPPAEPAVIPLKSRKTAPPPLPQKKKIEG